MLNRLSRHTLLAVLALALVIVAGVLVITRESGWLHNRLQEAITRQLTDLLEREVAVGPVTGDPLTGLTIHGLAVADDERLAEGAMFTAERIVLDYDLMSVIRGGLAPLASLSEVHVYGLSARVVRDQQGLLNLQKLLPPARKVPLAKRFRGRLFIHESAAAYTDYGSYARVRPLRVQLVELEGEVDLRQVTRLVAELSARVTDGKAERLTASLVTDLEGPFFNLDVSLAGLNAAWAYATFGAQPGLTVAGGRAEVEGSVYQVYADGKPQLDFSAQAEVRGLRVRSRELGAEPATLTGSVWAGMPGVRVDDLRAAWAGSSYEVRGWVHGYAAPTLDLQLTSPRASLSPIVNLLPAQARRGVSIPSSGYASVTAALIGPADNANLRLQVAMQDGLTVRLPELGVAQADELRLVAEVVALAQPSVRATVSGRRLQLPTLKPKLPAGTNWPQTLVIAPLTPFRASLQYCGGEPVAEATLQLPAVRADELRVANLRTRATIVDGMARLQEIRAETLGGALSGEAMLRLGGGPFSLQARGSLKGIDLARLEELPLELAEAIDGAADVDFQARVDEGRAAGVFGVQAANIISGQTTIQALSGSFGLESGEAWRGAGRLAATGVRHEGLQGERAEALVELDGDMLQIASGYWQGEEGLLWASGEVNLASREGDLEVAGAELAMRPLSHTIGLEDVAGTGYLSGRVTGTAAAPVFRGRLTVFEAEVGEYVFDALTAQVTYQPASLRASDLLVSRGGMVVSGEATLANLGLPTAQMGLAGSLRGEGLSLAQVVEFFGKDWPVTGLAEFTADLGGTLGQPRASGVLRLAHSQYDEFMVDQAVVPYRYVNERLEFQEAEATVFDAPVRASGSLALSDPPQLEASLSVGQVALQGLAPLLGENVPLGGMVSIPRLRVSGPLKSLQGQGQILATQLELGGETVRDVEARLSLARGQVLLEETTFELADGRVTASGVYGYAERPHELALQLALDDADIPDLLYLAMPIVEIADDRSEAEQAETRLALRSYALRVKGRLTGRVNLNGPVSELVAVADVRGRRLTLDDQQLPDLDGSGAVSQTALRDLRVDLRQGTAVVTVDGDMEFDGDIEATVEGSDIKLAQLRPWLPLDVAYGGTLGFTVAATGKTQRPELMMSVDVAAPSLAGVSFDILNIPTIKVSDGAIEIDTGVLVRQEQEVVIDGSVPFMWHLTPELGGQGRPGLPPTGEIKLGGNVEQTDLAFFMPLIDQYLRRNVPETPMGSGEADSAVPGPPQAAERFRWASAETKGKVQATYNLGGTVADPTLRGTFTLTDGAVVPPGWEHALESLQAELSFTGSGRENLVEVSRLEGAYDQVSAAVSGRMWLDRFAFSRFWENRFDLALKLAATSQELPGGTQLTNLGGGLSFRSEPGVQVLRPEKLAFGVGGGKVTVEGEARLRNFALSRLAHNDYNLSLAMTPGRLIYRNLINAMLGGRLEVVSVTSATEEVPRAVVRGEFALTDGMVGLVVPGTAGGAMYAASSRLPSPQLEVNVDLGQGLSLRGSGVSAQLDPLEDAVTLTGTPQAPTLVASLSSRSGTTTLPTASLRIEELAVDRFTVAPVGRGDPVRLEASGQVRGVANASISRPGDRPVRVRAEISGRLPDAITVSTSSDPALTEAQIYALLGGVPFAYLPGVGSGAGVGDVVSEQFLATLANAFRLRIFQPIEDEIKRALGLDELGITFAFDQAVSLQVGKYVVRNLLVSYERTLEGSDRYDLRVSYQLPGGLRITYHNDERNENRVEIGYTLTF